MHSRALRVGLLPVALLLGVGCQHAPKVGMKVTEEVVKASPGAAAEALKAAGSLAGRAKSNGAMPPPADPSAQAAAACSYQGVAPDGRAVYVCGGYPWVADPTTGTWVPYAAMPQAPPPPPPP